MADQWGQDGKFNFSRLGFLANWLIYFLLNNRYGHQIKTIQSEIWSKIDSEFNDSQSYHSVFPRVYRLRTYIDCYITFQK